MDPPQSRGIPEEIPVSATDKALWEMLVSNGLGNAVAECQAVRVLLRERKIAFGDAAVAAIKTTGAGPLYSATTAFVSLPVVSEDGRTAIAVTSTVSGPLAGGGQLWKMKKESGGNWKTVGMMGLWIS